MFTNRKNWLIGAVATTALAASAAAWSMGPGGGGDHDPGRMLEHMADKLDLTAAQQAGVEELMSASRKANEADRQRLQVLRQQLQAMRGDFDAGKAQGIADEIGQITSRMVFQASKTWSGVYQLLDTEQRQELDEMMKRRDQHRGKWRKGGDPSQQ